MLVFYALSGLPLWTTAILLLGVSTCLAALAPLLIRRAVGFERLVVNNEIAGFQYSTLGTSYAVLLALAVVAVWGDYRDAQRLVDLEASSWGNMYKLAEALPEPGRTNVRTALRDYIRALIDDEWPAMQQGLESERAAESLQALRTATSAGRGHGRPYRHGLRPYAGPPDRAVRGPAQPARHAARLAAAAD